MTLTSTEIKQGLDLYYDLPYHGRHHPMVVMSDAHALWRSAVDQGLSVTRREVDWDVVDGACLMHDAGYAALNGSAETNEERAARWSAAVFERRPKDFVAAVQEIILSTADHEPNNTVEAWLVCDADMAGFAKPWSEFLEANNGIEAEYLGAGLEPEQYNAGRRAFLEGVLAKAKEHKLYHFPASRMERHEQARKNLTRLLTQIP